MSKYERRDSRAHSTFTANRKKLSWQDSRTAGILEMKKARSSKRNGPVMIHEFRFNAQSLAPANLIMRASMFKDHGSLSGTAPLARQNNSLISNNYESITSYTQLQTHATQGSTTPSRRKVAIQAMRPIILFFQN